MSAPLVTVLVTHHLDENAKYLELCLESVKRQKGVDLEVIVLADTEHEPVVPEGFTLVHNRDLNTATKKVHFGIAMSDPRSKYFLLLSDDVIMGEVVLATLTHTLGEGLAVMNPMSNSDNGGQFITSLPWPCNVELEAVAPHTIDQVKTFPLVVSRPYICFYCTLIPRKVWEMVGPLDERLENRWNDVDYCKRAGQKGILSYIHFGCFALHFGSKTLDKVAPKELRDEASRVFMEKWPGAV